MNSIDPRIIRGQQKADDMFLWTYYPERIKMYRDGENLTFPDNLAWEGTALLNWPGDH